MMISVIIPNYNYAQYITQCIQSVLESDFDSENLEIIVVDDASTDDSVNVIEEVMKSSRFPFRLIKNETNLGLVLSRNRGISFARGEFLFFLDSDNYIRKDCIKTHVAVMQQNKDAIACFAPIQNFLNKTGEYCGLRSNRQFDYHQLLKGTYIDAMAMFRKIDLIGVGKYDSKMPPYGWEDYELWLRLGKMNKNVIFIHGDPLSFYRVHELNMSQNFKTDQYNHIVYYLKQKYPINQLLLQSETLDNLLAQNNQFAQLFYKNTETAYHESRSLTTAISLGTQTLHFTFNNPILVENLRFDPLNDYVRIQINSIQLLNQGKPLDIELKLSSNAINSENGDYLFDTTDPQVYIDFPLANSVELDEVIVELDYLQKGYEALEQLLKQKNIEIEATKIKMFTLTTLLQTSDFEKDCLQKELFENNHALQKQAEKIKLQNETISSNKTTTDELLNQLNHLESRIQSHNSELISIKRSYTYRLSKFLETLLLLFRPFKLKGLIIRKLIRMRDFKLLNQSSYFNTDYYLKNNLDVKQTEKSAIKHYLLFGGFEGRKPSEKFDSTVYLSQNPDVIKSGMNPLIHYLKFGEKECRSTH
jgi:glycosyltransferase involved in cell wall biosynthesis